MPDPAKALFDSLTSYQRIQELIDTGEAEGQYLECTAPASPQFTRDMRVSLAEAASGFANSGGGVILWGVSTDKQPHSGLDVLTQIAPIGAVKRLTQQIDLALPRLTKPSLQTDPTRVLHPSKGATKGIAVSYVPSTSGDPVQSTVDQKFYLRSGDEFRDMPYDILQRMFTSAQAPALRAVFDPRLITVDENGIWTVRVGVQNDSTAVARDVCVTIEVVNASACETITSAAGLEDKSGLNPGKRLFTEWMNRPIHRALSMLSGSLHVRMKRGKRPKRRLDLQVNLYADRMRARQWTFNVQLASSGFSIRDVKERNVY